MIGSADHMTDVVTVRNRRVRFGNGQELDAIGIGNLRGTTTNSEGQEISITVKNVLIVPGLAYNLLSVIRIIEGGGQAHLAPSSTGIYLERRDKQKIPIEIKSNLLKITIRPRQGSHQQHALTTVEDKESKATTQVQDYDPRNQTGVAIIDEEQGCNDDEENCKFTTTTSEQHNQIELFSDERDRINTIVQQESLDTVSTRLTGSKDDWIEEGDQDPNSTGIFFIEPKKNQKIPIHHVMSDLPKLRISPKGGRNHYLTSIMDWKPNLQLPAANGKEKVINPEAVQDISIYSTAIGYPVEGGFVKASTITYRQSIAIPQGNTDNGINNRTKHHKKHFDPGGHRVSRCVDQGSAQDSTINHLKPDHGGE
jgi:hypothetical protein